MRCLSLEKTELHSTALSEMITGDRSEVKRLVKLVTTCDPRGPMYHDSSLSFIKQEGKGNRISVFFLYTGCSQILASETNRVVDEFADQISRLRLRLCWS